MLSIAFFARSSFFTPWSSRPNAILLNTERWGNRPKFWKTIASSFRRTCNNSFSDILDISTPFTNTCPAVGRIRRLIQRSNVDFPLPESPIITKNSPSLIERLASFTPTVQPVSFRISSLLLSFFNILSAFCFSWPKIRYKSFISILLI